ncbi:MAG: hypothetical protein JNL90_11535 [Planctomycetes bacterium]|nr:hypothetical protein [Planctomycetota bacterium]
MARDPTASLSLLLLLLCRCAAPSPREHDLAADAPQLSRELDAELSAELAQRDPGDPLAGAPAVRAAQRRFLDAAARLASTGGTPLMVDVEHAGRGRMHETEFMVALDVAALVGGGRRAAERAEAAVMVQQADAELAAARSTTRLAVETRRAQLAEAQELSGALAALLEGAAPTRARLERLTLHGRLAPRDVAAAHNGLDAVAAERSAAEAMAANLRGELAMELGLPIEQLEASFAGLATWAPLEEGSATAPDAPRDAPLAPSLDAAQLLERVPRLRIARAEWLAAEAAVRVAAAEQWPALLLGPKAMLTSDDWVVGGLARLELPWPPAAAAAVDMARAARDAARAQLAGELAAAQATLAARTRACALAEASSRDHAQPRERRSAAQLEAATARFAADPAELPDWTMAIEQRMGALAAAAAARRAAAIARLERLEAEGALR